MSEVKDEATQGGATARHAEQAMQIASGQRVAKQKHQGGDTEARETDRADAGERFRWRPTVVRNATFRRGTNGTSNVNLQHAQGVRIRTRREGGVHGNSAHRTRRQSWEGTVPRPRI